MPGSAQRLFPMLSVEHLDRSLKFYGQLLGGQQSYQFPSEGEPVFVTLMFGQTEIGLGQIGDGPALHGQPLRPATGHRIELCVYVDDLDGKLSELRAAHVPIWLEPTLQPWGERVAYVGDPDGNLVMLVQ
jgi:catechol 2,3-dioxygenase-like lactoylglutathione lyase family enzyme